MAVFLTPMSDLLDLRDVSNYLIILGSDGIFSIRASKTSMEYKCTRLMGSLRTERYIYIFFPFYLRGREIVYGEVKPAGFLSECLEISQ